MTDTQISRLQPGAILHDAQHAEWKVIHPPRLEHPGGNSPARWIVTCRRGPLVWFVSHRTGAEVHLRADCPLNPEIPPTWEEKKPMAKISRGGATKLLEARNPVSGVVYILCSDGRILRRWPASMGGGVTQFAKLGKMPEEQLRTAFQDWSARKNMEVKTNA